MSWGGAPAAVLGPLRRSLLGKPALVNSFSCQHISSIWRFWEFHVLTSLPGEPGVKLITLGFLWFLPCCSPSPAASVKDVLDSRTFQVQAAPARGLSGRAGLPQPEVPPRPSWGRAGDPLGTHQWPGPRGRLPGEIGRLRGFSVGWHTPWLWLERPGSSGAVPRTSGCVLPGGCWAFPEREGRTCAPECLFPRHLWSKIITTFLPQSPESSSPPTPHSSARQTCKISLGARRSAVPYILVIKASFTNPWDIKQRGSSVCHRRLLGRQSESEETLLGSDAIRYPGGQSYGCVSPAHLPNPPGSWSEATSSRPGGLFLRLGLGATCPRLSGYT